MNLITDRTKDDVINLTAKGKYTNVDLNRVESAVETLLGLLNEQGYITTATTKTDWLITDVPYIDNELTRYLDNVKLLTTQFCLPESRVLPNSMDYLNYETANEIERVLNDIEQLIYNMQSAYKYCGVPICGDDIL